MDRVVAFYRVYFCILTHLTVDDATTVHWSKRGLANAFRLSVFLMQ